MLYEDAIHYLQLVSNSDPAYFLRETSKINQAREIVIAEFAGRLAHNLSLAPQSVWQRAEQIIDARYPKDKLFPKSGKKEGKCKASA